MSLRAVFSVSSVAFLLASAVASARTASLQPDPGNPDSIESQLKRYKGQTKFLNAESPLFKGAALRAAAGAGNRAVQESDVFKIGAPGARQLFLLNNYRGLQAVSFARGTENPAIVGRAAPTGNYPDDMYYDSKRERIVVLERLHSNGDDESGYDAVQSRVLVYDVRRAENPHVVQELPLEGEIADSRLVGDVLYVATSVRPQYTAWSNDRAAKGLVYSIRLGDAKMEVVQKVDLALPASARENMNIVEIEANGAYRYYLVAVLSQSGWGWWDRQSLVEVVDITDPQGAIRPLMVVSAKGAVAERSQTTIKDGTLIVTSNYAPAGENARMRIAVETFKLPTESSEVISEDEAQFRKLNLERQLRDKSGEEKDALEKRLLADRELGLADRFVKTAAGRLRKVLPDASVTVGDTTGLNATLQDVRYVGDLLYVFWVPQNLVDPFDLFDISQPQKEVRYLKRLQFDGWIERAIPLRHAGRDFVLGLGHIVPAVNNEDGRRYPQAKLFEVVGSGADLRAVDLAGIALNRGDLWTNFNGGDKYVEYRLGADGKGSILFSAHARVGERYVSGGKLIDFDLAAAAQGKASETFREGALLSASSDWLRRVFTNAELDRVHTFSDAALGTFDAAGAARADGVAEAVSILELARNVVAYVDLPVDGRYSRGLQIVQQGNLYEGAGTARTSLRLVDARRADSEGEDAHATLVLAGEYQAHLMDRRDGSLIVATRYRADTPENRYATGTRIHRVALGDSGLRTLGDSDLGAATNSSMRYGYETRFLQTADGDVLYFANGGITRVRDGDFAALALEDCVLPAADEDDLPRARGHAELKLLGDAFYLATTETVEDPSRPRMRYLRNFIAPVSIGAATAKCGTRINIPGRPLAIHADGHLVTEDERLVALRTYTQRFPGEDGKETVTVFHRAENETALESLRIADGRATLLDDYLVNGSSGDYRRLGGKRLGFFESEGERSYPRSGSSRFVSIDFDAELEFTREISYLGEDFLASATLEAVVADPAEAGAYFGVVTRGRELQIVRWAPKASRPAILPVSVLDVRFEKSKAATKATIPSSYYWGGSAVSYNPVLRSFQLSRGMTGVVQVFLAE